MKKITQSEFVSKSANEELARAVILQIGGWQSFKDSAPDISTHGIGCGFTGFIYNADTEKFAQRNLETINELLSSQAQETGYDSTFEMIRSFGCFKGGKLTDGEILRALCKGKNTDDAPNILNALAWYAGEEIAHNYCDLTEQLIQY